MTPPLRHSQNPLGPLSVTSRDIVKVWVSSQVHTSAQGLDQPLVVLGAQNGPTRLYLTRRIDSRGFHNRTTPP